MALIEIEIENYLGDIDTKYLVNELLKRKDAVRELFKHKEIKDSNINELLIPVFRTTEDTLDYIRLILRLKKWHSKESIIAEIEQL